MVSLVEHLATGRLQPIRGHARRIPFRLVDAKHGMVFAGKFYGRSLARPHSHVCIPFAARGGARLFRPCGKSLSSRAANRLGDGGGHSRHSSVLLGLSGRVGVSIHDAAADDSRCIVALAIRKNSARPMCGGMCLLGQRVFPGADALFLISKRSGNTPDARQTIPGNSIGRRICR